MGFFSDLKNSITGGAADVTVEIGPARRGESAHVVVRVAVKSNPISVNRVYLKFLGHEIAEIPADKLPARAQSAQPDRDHAFPTPQPIEVQEALDHGEFTLAPAQNLEANTTYTFEGSIPIPAHAPPTFQGKIVRIEWFAFAGLDMPGNDPDSGWKRFEVL